MVGSAAVPSLVGRDGELARIREVLAETSAGAGGCTIMTGPAGIGKTCLLDSALRDARDLGLSVAAGQATELDRAAPLSSLLGPLRRGDPRRFDLPPMSGHDGDRYWYIDRIGEALEAYVARDPLIIAIDDAQWTDELSALALRVLVPALASSPLRWLLARRTSPTASAGQSALDWLIEDGADQIRLGALDEASVSQLCTNVLGAAADATVLSMAARARGNPFLVEHLLSTLNSAGQIVISGGTATVIGDEVPSGFLPAVQRRLRDISPQARQLLDAGCVFGRAFTVHAAAALTAIPVPQLLAAAKEALAAGVLVEQDTQLAFTHDLIRQALYNNMAGPVRAAMHREAANVVRGEGRPAMEVADHLMRSGLAGDREAVGILRTAAGEIAGRAPGTAADLLTRALELVGDADPDRPELSAQAVGLLASSGRVAQARELGESALHANLDPTTEATLLLGLAEALKHAGQNQAAVDYARRALARSSVPAGIRAGLHAIAAHALLYVDDMASADQAGAEADREGMLIGEFQAAVFGSTARSVVARAQGRLADAHGHAAHAVRVADETRGAALHRHPRIWFGGALAAIDLFDDAETAYTTGRREAERLGSAWSQPLWHFYHASLLTSMGQLDEAVAEAEAGHRVAEQLTAQQLSVPLLGLLTRLAIMRAQPPVAREHLRRMQRLVAAGITAAPEDVNWTIAAVEDAAGRPEAAVSALATIYDRFPDRLLLLSNDPSCTPALVRLATRAADPARARATVAAARRLADLNPTVASLRGAADHAYGLLHNDLDALRAAVQRLRDSPRPLARASAAEDAGMAEHAAGNGSAAIELLESALDTCTACGDRRSVNRLERRLRTLGTRRRVAAPKSRSNSVLSGLTEAELRVAHLVAEGQSNRQVALGLSISTHTVDSHLRHIFGKLSIRSRVELTRIVVADEKP